MNSTAPTSTERSLLGSLVHYLSILLRFRWLILITTVATGILAAGFCIISLRLPPEESPLPNKYRAQSILLIQQTAGSDVASTIMSALGAEQRAIDAASGFDTGALMLLILQSRSILDQLVAEFDISRRYHIAENIKTRSRDALLRNLNVSYARTTGAITVSFVDIDPDLARDVVNRVVSLTALWFSQNRGYAKRQEIQLLEEKIGEVKSEIARLENSLKDLQKKYGVLTAQDLGSSQAVAVADLRSQLILKEIEIRNYANFSIVDDPHLQQLNEERRNILDMIEQTQKSILGTEALPADTKSLPDVAQEFAALTLELDIQRRIYNTLSPQYEAAKLTTESAPVFQVLETAEAPDMKFEPQRSRIVLIAVMLALAGSALLSFLINAVRELRVDARTQRKLPEAKRGDPR